MSDRYECVCTGTFIHTSMAQDSRTLGVGRASNTFFPSCNQISQFTISHQELINDKWRNFRQGGIC